MHMTTLRSFLHAARQSGDAIHIARPVDPYLEMASVIAALDGRPVVFDQVQDRSGPSEFKVISGVCSDSSFRYSP